MKAAVVILNWNTREFLHKWLPGLIAACTELGNGQYGSEAEVIVADNASTDDSLELVRREFPEVRIIELDRNYGFTGGYNRALSRVNAEYYLLINTDIDADGSFLRPLVEWMDAHPECGVCAPKLHALLCTSGNAGSEDAVFERSRRFEYAGAAGGMLDRFGFPFCRGRVMSRTEEDCGQYDEPTDVLWATGACMMTRSRLWKELGGLDERFFAHMEEIDYCWRVQLSGYKVTVVPQSVVWHLGGGTLPQTSPFKLKLNFRNCLMMLEGNLKPTFMAAGMGRKMAGLRAGIIISVRKLLDLAAAAVYFASGRAECARAVLDAHREYRKLRANVAERKTERVPDGITGICIIPLSAIKGDKVFDSIREYESRNRRCR